MSLGRPGERVGRGQRVLWPRRALTMPPTSPRRRGRFRRTVEIELAGDCSSAVKSTSTSRSTTGDVEPLGAPRVGQRAAALVGERRRPCRRRRRGGPPPGRSPASNGSSSGPRRRPRRSRRRTRRRLDRPAWWATTWTAAPSTGSSVTHRRTERSASSRSRRRDGDRANRSGEAGRRASAGDDADEQPEATVPMDHARSPRVVRRSWAEHRSRRRGLSTRANAPLAPETARWVRRRTTGRSLSAA